MDSRTRQVVTYLGNKRKLCSTIEGVLEEVLEGIGQDKAVIGEPFSGSGVVSRMLRDHATRLHVNDAAPFAREVAQCYLEYVSPDQRVLIGQHIAAANDYADQATLGSVPQWMSAHWTCKNEEDVKAGERLYYTPKNALRIDAYRHYIETMCPAHLRSKLLGPLLYECSVHTNTNGNFAGFYRSQEGRPWGGDRHIDERRITAEIRLTEPPYHDEPDVDVHVHCGDAEEVMAGIGPVDIVYIDPPYNKHPYATYYFMLDLIAEWDTSRTVPSTTRGQDSDWRRSAFNSFSKAKGAMKALVESIDAKVIMLSYNNRGIIPEEEMRAILEQKGDVTLLPLVHNTYNKMQGIAAKKRTKPDAKTVEHLWIVKSQ